MRRWPAGRLRSRRQCQACRGGVPALGVALKASRSTSVPALSATLIVGQRMASMFRRPVFVSYVKAAAGLPVDFGPGASAKLAGAVIVGQRMASMFRRPFFVS